MTESVLPTEAVEAAAHAVFDSEVVGPRDALVDEQPVRDILAVGLEAALPFLREQWMAEWEQVGWAAPYERSEGDEGTYGWFLDHSHVRFLPEYRPVFVLRQDTET